MGAAFSTLHSSASVLAWTCTLLQKQSDSNLSPCRTPGVLQHKGRRLQQLCLQCWCRAAALCWLCKMLALPPLSPSPQLGSESSVSFVAEALAVSSRGLTKQALRSGCDLLGSPAASSDLSSSALWLSLCWDPELCESTRILEVTQGTLFL